MIQVHVECYSGYKGAQRPLRFRLGDRLLQIEEVEDQWHSPDATYFRVRADDGDAYILRYDAAADRWSLAAFRSHASARH